MLNSKVNLIIVPTSDECFDGLSSREVLPSSRLIILTSCSNQGLQKRNFIHIRGRELLTSILGTTLYSAMQPVWKSWDWSENLNNHKTTRALIHSDTEKHLKKRGKKVNVVANVKCSTKALTRFERKPNDKILQLFVHRTSCIAHWIVELIAWGLEIWWWKESGWKIRSILGEKLGKEGGIREVPGLRKGGRDGMYWPRLLSALSALAARCWHGSEGMAHCRLVALSQPNNPLLSNINPQHTRSRKKYLHTSY